jgi:hypothetical protein
VAKRMEKVIKSGHNKNLSSLKISDRLKLKINATPNFTARVTGHGYIKTYVMYV